VVRTRVGYAGGTKENPTYHNLGDHTETIQIDYDPEKISYEKLLEVFWDSHHPTSKPWSRQYMSIISYHNEEQKRLAMESKKGEEERLGSKIYTEIIPATEFYLAEDYHQKYSLQGVSELKKDFKVIYPDIRDFIDSTAVARVNGYIDGYGSLEILEENLNSFGLSAAGKKKLIDITTRWGDKMTKGDACAIQ
jgi:peptide-methionine (S)-S-oxide reductase